jgi:hypothetical protein
VHSTTGGFPIVNQNTPSPLIWGEPGTLPAVSGFMRFGSGTTSVGSEPKWDTIQPFLASQLTVRCIVAPGLGESVNFITRKNGVDTVLSIVLQPGILFVRNYYNAVTFDTGDTISMMVVPSGATLTTDCIVSISMY